MSLNDLVASQLEEEVPTSSETETVMEDEDRAYATSENADGEEGESNESEDAPEEKSRLPKRIDSLIKKQRELEEQLIAERAKREALESMRTDSEPKTLEDLDVNGLTKFIANAENDPDLEGHLPRAKELLLERQIEQKFNKRIEEQERTAAQKMGEQLTATMISNLAGEKIRNKDGDYYAIAENYLNDLSSEQYKTINKDQLLAVALAEVAYLKKQNSGPSLQERAIQNKNKVIANNRSGSTGTADISEMLREYKTLSPSRQGSSGNLRSIIKELDVVKGLTQ